MISSMLAGTVLSSLAGLLLGAGVLPQPVFREITVDDGLPASTVYDVKQDAHGFLWFATEYGIARYDGNDFEIFTTADGLPDNVAYRMQRDSTGKLWFLSLPRNLSWHDGARFHVLEEIDGRIPDRGSVRITSAVTDPSGRIHVGLVTGGHWIVETDGTVHEARPTEDRKGAIFQEIGADILACSRPDAGANDSGERLWWVSGGRAASMHDPAWNSYLPAVRLSDGGVAFGGRKKLVVRNALDAAWSVDLSGPDEVLDIAERLTGQLSIPVGLGGLVTFSRTGPSAPERRSFEFPTRCVEVDTEGGLWVGLFGGGVRHQPGTDAVTYEFLPEHGGPEVVALTPHPDGGILAATAGASLYRIADGRGEARLAQELFSSRVFALRADEDGGVWIAARSATSRLHAGVVTSVLDRSTYDVLPGQDGHALLATYNGVCHSTSEDRLFPSSERRRYYALHRGPTGRTWAGSRDGLHELRDETLVDWADTHSSLGQRVQDIEESRSGRVFVGTLGAGLLVLEGDHVRAIRSEHGLASDVVESLFLQDGEALWVGTSRGVTRLRLPLPSGPPYDVEALTRHDGLPSNEVRDLTLVDDTMWIATAAGLTAISIRQAPLAADVPARIERVLVNDEEILQEQLSELSHDQNDLQFDFAGLSIGRDPVVSFACRLTGPGDPDEWQTPFGTARRANLEPGRYALEVSAVSADGRRSRQPARVTFHVRPAFWQTRLFSVTLVALLVGTSALLVRVRAEVVRRREMARVQRQLAELKLEALRAQVNPHFMFNTMASIQYYLMENDAPTAADYLAKFARLLRRVLEHSERQFVTVEEEIETLELYLELEAARSKGDFTYSLSVDPDIDSELERIPAMIIQTHAENAIWHGLAPSGGSGRLDIDLRRVEDGILCTIRDNGVGYDGAREREPKDSGPRGSKIAEERLRLLSERAEVAPRVEVTATRDEAGRETGTKVEMLLPVG